jgi:polyhydroxybutyrate depolymerase
VLALAFAATTLLVHEPVAAALAYDRPASACKSSLTPGGHTVTLSSGSRQRSALVHVPRGIPSGHHVPLVLVLHGAGGNGPKMERYSGFSRTADRYSFIAIYPSAAGPVWNQRALSIGTDDVAFLSALVTRVRHTGCVDARRIFATGVSNGAGMVALLGCRLSALHAIASVDGDYSEQPRCQPSHALRLLEIHGTADQIAPYFGPGDHPSSNGLPPFVNAWVRIDGCSRHASSRALATHTTLYSFGGCTNGVVVDHIRIQGGGHQWPGANPPDPGPPATICGTCTIWSFFSRGHL